jgi:hypothetical protein
MGPNGVPYMPGVQPYMQQPNPMMMPGMMQPNPYDLPIRFSFPQQEHGLDG